MHCVKCGIVIKEGASFCAKCGVQVDSVSEAVIESNSVSKQKPSSSVKKKLVTVVVVVAVCAIALGAVVLYFNMRDSLALEGVWVSVVETTDGASIREVDFNDGTFVADVIFALWYSSYHTFTDWNHVTQEWERQTFAGWRIATDPLSAHTPRMIEGSHRPTRHEIDRSVLPARGEFVSDEILVRETRDLIQYSILRGGRYIIVDAEDFEDDLGAHRRYSIQIVNGYRVVTGTIIVFTSGEMTFWPSQGGAYRFVRQPNFPDWIPSFILNLIN